MRVVVLGTRGFPDIQGGVEKHCEELYPRLAALGCEVIVLGRQPYVGEAVRKYKDVIVGYLPCPKQKFLEAPVHTLLGVYGAKKLNADIVHIHGVGPALFTLLARMKRMKVVVTHHGPDYWRAKWNWFARMVLRAGEWIGCKAASEVICISGQIAQDVEKKFRRKTHVIPNGVEAAQPDQAEQADEILRTHGLERGKYILAVGRFVPEKGFGELIEAFKIASGVLRPRNDGSWKLVITGDADHEDAYSRKLKEQAARNPGVVLTGFLSGVPLKEIYAHAGLFVLPSHYEGLPIVLLEALRYGLSCVVSDIPANRDVGLTEERYFKPGDVQGMAEKIGEFVSRPLSKTEREFQAQLVARKFNWDRIAEQTFQVYQKIISKNPTL